MAVRDVQNGSELRTDPRADAAAAGLRYVEDGEPGFSRRRRGKGFEYLDIRGKTLSDAGTKERVSSLAIPPAWRDVWICPHPDGHLQATGRDEAGRKQYIYHPEFTALRDAAKFARLTAFGDLLPRIRRKVRRDLRRGTLDRARLVAAAVRLLDAALIRIGNPVYAKQNGSYGVTTLRRKHVRLNGAELDLRFQGKSGERHSVTLIDDELASVVRDTQELPGYELFRYLDESGERQTVDSRDVNEYLAEVTGVDVTAKDFRTWGGTVATAASLYALWSNGAIAEASEAKLKRALNDAICSAADTLGNTPAVCRRSYVHPVLIERFMARDFGSAYDEALTRARLQRRRELKVHEAATLGFLEE